MPTFYLEKYSRGLLDVDVNERGSRVDAVAMSSSAVCGNAAELALEIKRAKGVPPYNVSVNCALQLALARS